MLYDSSVFGRRLYHSLLSPQPRESETWSLKTPKQYYSPITIAKIGYLGIVRSTKRGLAYKEYKHYIQEVQLIYSDIYKRFSFLIISFNLFIAYIKYIKLWE